MQTKARLPGKVLVVDDDKSARQLFAHVLGGAGHTVTVARSGEEALQCVAHERFDLLIVDKNLPGVDGMEVLRLARCVYPGLEAIVVTAFSTPKARHQATDLGVRAYFNKPFGVLAMLGACDAAIAAARRVAAER